MVKSILLPREMDSMLSPSRLMISIEFGVVVYGSSNAEHSCITFEHLDLRAILWFDSVGALGLVSLEHGKSLA